MNRAAFFEAADQLSRQIKNLLTLTEQELCMTEDILCRKREPFDEWPDDEKMSLALGVIAGHFDEVMKAFDVAAQAAGWPPRFHSALLLLDAPESLQRKIQKRLEHNLAMRRRRRPE